MNPKFSSLLRKTIFLLGAISLGWTAKTNAQSTPSSDTTHRQGMHHRWGGRNGSDSAMANRFHKGPDGFRGGRGGFDGGEHSGGRGEFNGGRGDFRGERGMAFHRGGERGGRGRFGGHRGWNREGGIHYTPEQRKQVADINKDYRQRSQDLYKKDNLTLREYKAGLLSLQKEKKTKLESLLTQKQKDEIAARRKRMTENQQVMAAAHMERLRLRLNLSDDQVAKIKAGQENLRTQARAIHENDNLLPEQKMQQLKTLMAKRNDTYKSVLTPEQYTQFEKMGMGRHGRGFGGGRRGNFNRDGGNFQGRA